MARRARQKPEPKPPPPPPPLPAGSWDGFAAAVAATARARQAQQEAEAAEYLARVIEEAERLLATRPLIRTSLSRRQALYARRDPLNVR